MPKKKNKKDPASKTENLWTSHTRIRISKANSWQRISKEKRSVYMV